MELFETLETYLAEAGYIGALGKRQARLLCRSAATRDLQAEARIVLLLNLAALSRGAPRAHKEFLLEPLSGDAIAQQIAVYRHENENRDPVWSADLSAPKTLAAVAGMLDAALQDPGRLAPLTGEMPAGREQPAGGAVCPLLIVDRRRCLAGFSRYLCAASALERNLRERLRRPLLDLPAARAAAILERIFVAEPVLDKKNTSHVRQAAAVALALRAPFLVLSGGPGTGKTSVVVQILRALLAAFEDIAPDRIALCAPTGRAKARLGECVDRDIAALEAKSQSGTAPRTSRDGMLRNVARKTLHGLLGIRPDGSMKYNRAQALPYQVVVVDEASMVDLYHFNALMEAASPGCRILLVGDMHQLPPVEAGAVLGDLTRRFDSLAGHPTLRADVARWVEQVVQNIPLENGSDGGNRPVVLSTSGQTTAAGSLADHAVILVKSHRSVQEILDVADSVNRGDCDGVLKIIAEQKKSGPIEHVTRTGIGPVEAWFTEQFPSEKLDAIARLRDLGPDTDGTRTWTAAVEAAFAEAHESRILTLAHDGLRGRRAINALADRLLRPLLDKGNSGPFFHGQQVVLGLNHHDLDLYNGDTGIMVHFASGGLKAVFRRGGSFAAYAADRLAGLESAFAVTVHKAQGSEFNRVMLVLPEYLSPLLTRQIIYTGITRARQRLCILGATDLLRLAVNTRQERHGGVELEGE